MTDGRDGRSPDGTFACRLLASLLVLWGNGEILSGAPAPTLWDVPFASLGIALLFAAGGCRLAERWDARPELRAYASHGARRIWPGLAACTLLTAFVAGPLLTARSPGAYLAGKATWHYLGNLVLFSHRYLPGVFEHAHVVGVVDGTLSALFPGAVCAGAVPLLGRLADPWRAAAFALAGLLCGIVGLLLPVGPTGRGPIVWGADLAASLAAAPFFFGGACWHAIARRRPGLVRGDLALLGVVATAGVAAWFGRWNVPLQWVLLPYAVALSARGSISRLRLDATLGDLSYGVFLWSFPIAQAVVTRTRSDQPVLLCLAITLPVAFLSWHVIERPALGRGRWLLSPGERRP